jgi:hypothetical protein
MRWISLFFICLSAFAHAQDGGRTVYSFLEIPASARVAALGGTFIAVYDNDLNAALQAPSLLNRGQDKQLTLGMVSYFDGVKVGDVAFAKSLTGKGTFMASMHYANYGNFKLTNAYGDIEGDFKAADYCMNLGWGYRYNERFSLGATFKLIYSDYYLYNALGAAIDVAATYLDTAHNFTATLLGRNVGMQLDQYVKGNDEQLPGEVLVSFSKRLSHTPLRFSVTYRHVEKFDLSYTDPYDLTDVDPLTGDATIRTYSFGNKLIRHFIVGSEILLTRNFHLRAAYNFQRRQELAVDTRSGTVGFSLGFGLKISKFIISYGRGKYHLAAASNHFSISMNLADFTKK